MMISRAVEGWVERARARRHSAPRPHRPTHTNTEAMSTVLARVTVTASAAKAPVAKTNTAAKTVAPQRASIGARAVALAKTNVPAAVALVNAVAASPAHAEAGKLFDFDLTLPIIATEFLLLMTILDKTVFGPVGKALDDRDELIRSQLAAVGDNSSEVESLIVSVHRA
jgi:F-type H+-transporting ATPase subunit b